MRRHLLPKRIIDFFHLLKIICKSHFLFFFRSKRIDLIGKVPERSRERSERERENMQTWRMERGETGRGAKGGGAFPSFWFTPGKPQQMGLNEAKQGARSFSRAPLQVAGVQTLGLCPTAFLALEQEAGSEVEKLRHAVTAGDNLTCVP